MKPVWIKYYGLIPMTRHGYLITLAVAAVFALVVYVAALALGYLPPISTLWDPDPIGHAGIAGWIYDHTHLLILLCVVAQVIDTWVTLRVFAQREEERAGVDWERLAEDWPEDRRSRDATTVEPDDNIRKS
jgi:hypothetical protein